MFNWFWKWARGKMVNVAKEQEEMKFSLGAVSNQLVREVDSINSEKSIQFTMLLAEGGVVLQQCCYNQKTDRSNRKLYLIPEDQDVATRVGEIVAIELMKV